MGFGKAVIARLYELCAEQKITINKLCDRSAVPQSTVNNFINGKTHNMGILTLKKLIDGLEMTVPEFFDTDVFRNLEQEIK
ncbi:MAG: helix-turn-helix transcriptional regulator [Oscillospiraceae bacterium]|jgi:transcriptional regulator with XRE-family HTH domain|nr:helix-turn-helix transcriptional regulator [Oscillospiraceae bacterium]